MNVTRGVTARPAIRGRRRTLYQAAIMLDLNAAKALIKQMDAERADIVEQARRDISSLRSGVGPVIPVRVEGAAFQLKALGEKMPVQFDLNAMSAAVMALLPALDGDAQARIERERDRAPFLSPADFVTRTGLSLEHLGLVEVGRRR